MWSAYLWFCCFPISNYYKSFEVNTYAYCFKLSHNRVVRNALLSFVVFRYSINAMDEEVWVVCFLQLNWFYCLRIFSAQLDNKPSCLFVQSCTSVTSQVSVSSFIYDRCNEGWILLSRLRSLRELNIWWHREGIWCIGT